MLELNSKERMIIALELGKPDRAPASVHQWQPFHLSHYLGGISDLDAFRRFGLDASLARFPLIPEPHPDWVAEYVEVEAPTGEERYGEKRYRVTVKTPGGVLENMVAQNEITRWNVTPLMKRHEDLELVERYMPVPKLDKAALQKSYDELGDDGIMRGFVFGEQGGCWQDATCLYGTEELILEAADNPEWVKEFMTVLWSKKERFIEESLVGAAYDLIETGGGAASSTVISPDYFREFCLPYDQKMHDKLHQIGHRVVYHTCGGMMPILELIAENRCDACETLTPPSMGGDARPTELKKRVGSRSALIGGLDQNTVLEKGTEDEIRQHVRAMFEDYGAGGGYIISPSDHFFNVSASNLEAYAKAARECVYG